MLRIAFIGAFAATLAPFVLAQDVTFTKSGYYSPKFPNEIKVDLTLTATKMIINSQNVDNNKKNKEKENPIDVEVPFKAIDTMSYEVGGHHRAEDMAFSTVMVLTKEKSYYLDIKYQDGAAKKVVVLRLDKSECKDVIATLEAKTGKKIETVDEKTSPVNPTAGSKDVDEVVPYAPDAVGAALKPAMESMGCNITKAEPGHVECKRLGASSGRDRDRTGIGGEKVVASLRDADGGTRVRIETEKGFVGHAAKKNWSSPIFREMLNNLQVPTDATKTSPPAN